MRWPRRDMHALSGAYALDAVGEPERKRFERHLAGCPSCQREVRGLQEAAGRFAVAVSAEPPARMRARVLEAVASVPPALSTGDTRERRVRGSGWPRRLALPLAAACLALAIAFGVLFAINQDQLDSTRSQDDKIADVLSAPGTQVISRKTSIGGLVTVDVAGAMGEFVLTTDDMPGLPASETYQVWVLEPRGKALSDGLLNRIPEHRTAPILASGLVRGDKMGLTVEPAGGTAKPTTRLIVDIALPS